MKTALALFGLLAAATAQAAASPEALRQRALAATCANCHGTDGRAIAQGELPSLAGLPKAYLLEQLAAFRDGRRPATVMHQLTKGYTPEQLDAIATWFAAQPR
jgi:cytochrome c553